MLAAELEAAKTLCSQLAPQFLLLGRRLGTKTPASVSRTFFVGIHNRAPQKGVLTKDPLSAPNRRRRSPPEGWRRADRPIDSRVRGLFEHQHRAGDFAGLHRAEGFVDVLQLTSAANHVV